ncbi:MAG: hypothetical protein GWN01_06915 [Nitrosopumilaceae archaeon]|nr:hypothetical protein [Nitrosopumilaceae archaeon]NIX61266.1 hypothetical protein [Nitrosopumilaceae archaeon]
MIVVHHWGRGVSFELNDGTPPLKPLQVGLKGKWEIISCQPCIAVTSGGTDPISDLIECFFKPDEEISGNFLKIEDRLNNECAAQEEDLK